MGVVDFGSAGWDQLLNDWLAAHDISDTGWTEDGIVYINGAQRDSVDPLQYRIIKIGSVTRVQVAGWLGGFTIASGAKLDVATLPSNVASLISGAHSLQGRESVIGSSSVGTDINGSNIQLNNYGTNGNLTDGLWLDWEI